MGNAIKSPVAAAAAAAAITDPGHIPPDQAVELGTINYVNLSPNQKHGDIKVALAIAAETGKPIFANFVEW